MMAKYRVSASYRFRLNPKTGETGPIPIWSLSALKSSIIEEEEDD